MFARDASTCLSLMIFCPHNCPFPGVSKLNLPFFPNIHMVLPFSLGWNANPGAFKFILFTTHHASHLLRKPANSSFTCLYLFLLYHSRASSSGLCNKLLTSFHAQPTQHTTSCLAQATCLKTLMTFLWL